ncbi:hypothetical protein Hdeb2414_s0105g00795471 [Helianthus debilis subsp. tardiflorus]
MVSEQNAILPNKPSHFQLHSTQKTTLCRTRTPLRTTLSTLRQNPHSTYINPIVTDNFKLLNRFTMGTMHNVQIR